MQTKITYKDVCVLLHSMLSKIHLFRNSRHVLRLYLHTRHHAILIGKYEVKFRNRKPLIRSRTSCNRVAAWARRLSDPMRWKLSPYLVSCTCCCWARGVPATCRLVLSALRLRWTFRLPQAHPAWRIQVSVSPRYVPRPFPLLPRSPKRTKS